MRFFKPTLLHRRRTQIIFAVVIISLLAGIGFSALSSNQTGDETSTNTQTAPASKTTEHVACGQADRSRPDPLPLDTTTRGVSVHEIYSYYEVEGTTIPEVRSSLRRCSGSRFNALAYPNVNWKFDLSEREDDMCRLENVRVGVNIRYTLPSWTEEEQGDDAAKEAWTSYIKSTHMHEEDHGDIFKQHAQKIHDELLNFEEARCSSIENRANAAAGRIINEMDRATRQYDIDTDHGRTQGAVFGE